MSTFTSESTTNLVRAGIDTDTAFGAVIPPLVLSSNFSFEEFGQKRQYDYTRSGNPTRDLLADALAQAEQGAGGVITSTGLASITLVLQAFLAPGDTLVVPHDAYGGSWRLFRALASKGHFKLHTLDLTRPGALEQALLCKPKLVLLETPSNPLLRITDIVSCCKASKEAGALVVVDNTFLSPALQNPLSLGADLVVHSTTKYINGHGDVVGGAVIAKDKALIEPLTWWANALGLTGSPFDSFLTLRGLRTLHARMRVHQENAQVVAEALVRHEAVDQVYYPGLASHPGYELGRQQQRGGGGMISFQVRDERKVAQILSTLQHFTLAESLGGVESLVAHPATMTHAAMTEQARIEAGITQGLLRLSVGIEHPHDLVSDLVLALDKAL